MQSNVLVTGINGFVGKHLSLYMHTQGVNVYGAGSEDELHPEIKPLVTDYYKCDLTVKDQVDKLPFEKFDSVIHLAGLAAVGPSFSQPLLYIEKNTAMLINLAEAAILNAKKQRFVVVSSGAVYSSDQSMPLTESSDIGYTSPYVVSKMAIENMCTYYDSRGLSTVIVRPFNHIGPGQGLGFLLPDLVDQILSNPDSKSLTVGNLKTKRDFTDVRDVVKAYTLLATAEEVKHHIYNICSGKSHSGEEILQAILDKLNAKDLSVEVDASKVRPTDAPDIYGSSELITNDTGWRPEIPFEQSIADYIDWAKQQKS